MNTWMTGKKSIDKDFYSILDMKDITDIDYRHKKIVWEDFQIKNLGQYQNLYVRSDTVLLANTFKNFQNMCLEICKLDPACFLTAPGLLLQVALNKVRLKLELLRDTEMLLMVGKGIKNGLCHAILGYMKANNKYIKDYDNKKESPYLRFQDVNNFYEWAMSQKLSLNDFIQAGNRSKINEYFTKNYNEGSEMEYEFYNDLPFLPEKMKIEKVKKLESNFYDKNDMLYT